MNLKTDYCVREFLLKEMGEMSHKDKEVWMAKQAYIALGNLLTVCALEGIDACPMEGFEPPKYDEILGLSSQGLRAVLLLPVGHRSAQDAFSKMEKVRRGLDEVIVELD